MTLSYVLKFIADQRFLSLPLPTPTQTPYFQNRTIIVTGSNVGLGFEAARHFTALGAAKVILAVRNADKGQKARESIEGSTGREKGVVEVWPLDLGSYASVKAFASRAVAELERLDVLVENAGIAVNKYERLEDNESTITVNVVSTFLLALLLLPKLRETAAKFPSSAVDGDAAEGRAKPHLVIVSSEVHFLTAFAEKDAPEGKILDTLNNKTTANMADRYNVSKLLEVFFTRELAARSSLSTHPDDGVVINFLNPGLCHSELARNAGFGLWLMKALLARTTEQGSRTLVHAAAAGVESHGQYLSNCRVAAVAPLVQEDEKVGGKKVQRRVWEEVVKKLERIQPGVLENL